MTPAVPDLLSLIDQMHANVDRYITPFFGKEEVSAELYTVDEHSQIISACEAGYRARYGDTQDALAAHKEPPSEIPAALLIQKSAMGRSSAAFVFLGDRIQHC